MFSVVNSSLVSSKRSCKIRPLYLSDGFYPSCGNRACRAGHLRLVGAAKKSSTTKAKGADDEWWARRLRGRYRQ